MNKELRALVDLHNRTLQKSRVAFGLRIGAIKRGSDEPTNGSIGLLQRWEKRFLELEKEAEADIKSLASDLPIIDMMIEVKGIGYLLAAKVVAMIDIQRVDTASALWRYAGYGVVGGEREKPIKGEKLHYNIRLKTACYLVGCSFLRSNSPYRSIYDQAREYYLANRPGWTKAHQHQAALRKMIKVWLAHVFNTWRILEGLPLRPLYVQEKLNHQHMYKAVEFGWPPLKERDEQEGVI